MTLKTLTLWLHNGTLFIRHEGVTRTLYFRGEMDFEEAKRRIMEAYQNSLLHAQ